MTWSIIQFSKWSLRTFREHFLFAHTVYIHTCICQSWFKLSYSLLIVFITIRLSLYFFILICHCFWKAYAYLYWGLYVCFFCLNTVFLSYVTALPDQPSNTASPAPARYLTFCPFVFVFIALPPEFIFSFTCLFLCYYPVQNLEQVCLQ